MTQESIIEQLLKIIVIIVCLPFVILWYIWAKTDWTKRNKWIATVALAVVFLFALMSDSPEKKKEASTISQKTNEQVKAIEEVKTKTESQSQGVQPEPQNNELSPEEVKEVFKVAHVVDGDTIKLENGQVVRYIGIDTPETVDPRKPVQCFGKEASNKNNELVEGKEVKLVKDVSETDKYGRILRYVYIGDIFVNEYLVRNGFAHSYSYPPDIKFQDQFRKAEGEARNNKRGLWADDACKIESSSTPSSSSSQSNSQSNNNVPATIQSDGSYSCNCSKTCPQMSSCAEAQYQLNACGCSKRDADHDGIACDADCQ